MVSQKGDDGWDFFEPWSPAPEEASAQRRGLMEGHREAAADEPLEDPDAPTNSDTLPTND